MLFVLSAFALTPAWSAAQESAKPFGQGTHAFRGIIHSPKPIPGYEKRFDLQPIKEYGPLDPANTTVIVLGGDAPLDRLGGLRRFVNQGGALLIATDQAVRHPHPLSRDFGVEVRGGYVESVRNNFAGLKDCPLVNIQARDHPLFRRVETIATNRPSVLVAHPASPLQIFARLTPQIEMGNRRRFEDYAFMAGGQLGAGRILVIADHSIFINDMMLQADTDNFDFAYNCIDWLSESGRRKQVLLIEDGEIVTNFNVSFKPPPLPKLPSQEQVVERVNQLLAEAESKDQFNNVLLGLFGGWGSPRDYAQAVAHERILKLLLVLLTGALATYGLIRVIAARQRFDRAVPLLATSTGLAVPAQPIHDLRRQALAQGNNCSEVARHLARRCLESAGCASWDVQPRVASRGNPWQRWTMSRKLRRIWRLASASRPPRVSPRQLQTLTEELEALKGDFASGKIRILGPAGPAKPQANVVVPRHAASRMDWGGQSTG